jgi:hypothetical protein
VTEDDEIEAPANRLRKPKLNKINTNIGINASKFGSAGDRKSIICQ